MPLKINSTTLQKIDNPLYFYIDLEDKSSYYLTNDDLVNTIINSFKTNKDEKETKMKGFWDFLKKKD